MGSQPPLMARLPVNSGGLLPGKVPLCPFLLEQQRLLKASGYRAASCRKESLRLVGVNFILIQVRFGSSVFFKRWMFLC